jgi:S-methylmethionine-dependent homocysteine/selenocysteine methylase
MAPPIDEAADLYAEIALLQAPMVDLIMCETMSGLDQAAGALKGATQGSNPVWICCSVDDEDGSVFRNGDPIEGILDLAGKYGADAVLLNCSIPEAVSQALSLISGKGMKTGAYANGFTKITKEFAAGQTSVDLLQSRKDLTPAAYADFAESWAEMGATVIGGCCEVGPAHIAELKNRFRHG